MELRNSNKQVGIMEGLKNVRTNEDLFRWINNEFTPQGREPLIPNVRPVGPMNRDTSIEKWRDNKIVEQNSVQWSKMAENAYKKELAAERAALPGFNRGLGTGQLYDSDGTPIFDGGGGRGIDTTWTTQGELYNWQKKRQQMQENSQNPSDIFRWEGTQYDDSWLEDDGPKKNKFGEWLAPDGKTYLSNNPPEGSVLKEDSAPKNE